MLTPVQLQAQRIALGRILSTAFGISWFALYFWKTLGENERMTFFMTIPTLPQRGGDLLEIILKFRDYFLSHGAPYPLPYPPFSAFLYRPLTWIDPNLAYGLTTLTIIAVTIWLLFWRLEETPRPYKSLVSLSMIPLTLGSYGLIFELERGQTNSIAIALALFGVTLFRRGARMNRGMGLVLFSFAVQLKVYPILLAVLFFDRWPRPNILIQTVLFFALLQVLLSLSLGPEAFLQFMANLQSIAGGCSVYVCSSARSYLTYLHSLGYQILHPEALTLSIILFSLLLIFITFLGPESKSIRQSPYKVLNLFLAMLIIPMVSFDYKLALLSTPISLLFRDWFEEVRPEVCGWFGALLCFILSIGYFCTLFSFVYRPSLIVNAFPLLMGMMLTSSLLHILRINSERKRLSAGEGAF